ncbi:hypothetical protein P8H27_15640 [Pseudomonas sp. sp1636]|uniref:hypothetical protein n=1 Tax=Pseudomonas sp. sp1636 TaxID=3036707 RepID=UPI0025A5B842|nr:hypothetical protein [Pseudomonas sp. sp1636]MDM8350312.1 hypothetical protein [Pseudomonas sp. sp1636]
MSFVVTAYADACWRELQDQRDLVRDLDAITDRREAMAFLQCFENRLCVYSGYAQKLYSHYSFVVPQSDHGDITILPVERSWSETFHDIPIRAVEPTGIHLLPGEAIGHAGLYLKIPSENRLVASKELPFQEGLRLVIQRYRAKGECFLPVLIKEDLRGFEARMPSLHLHRINLAQLTHCAPPNINAIKDAIARHLLGLFRQD